MKKKISVFFLEKFESMFSKSGSNASISTPAFILYLLFNRFSLYVAMNAWLSKSVACACSWSRVSVRRTIVVCSLSQSFFSLRYSSSAAWMVDRRFSRVNSIGLISSPYKSFHVLSSSTTEGKGLQKDDAFYHSMESFLMSCDVRSERCQSGKRFIRTAHRKTALFGRTNPENEPALVVPKSTSKKKPCPWGTVAITKDKPLKTGKIL